MHSRRCSSVGLVGLVVVALLAPTPAAAQAPSGADYTVPRTAWGDPDFQGIWTSDDGRSTPLQRPEEFGERLYLTEQELADRTRRDNETRGDTRAGAGTFVGEVGTRTLPQTSLIVEPANGRLPGVTLDARERAALAQASRQDRGPADSWEDRSMMERCISRGVMGILPSLYGNGLRIVQSPGHLAVAYEMIHDTRVIPIGGSLDATPRIASYMGTSVGRWEGDSLVVETTNFTDKLDIARTVTSPSLRLVERFTRVSDDTINYEVTVTDPETWERPWKVLLPLSSQPGYDIFPFECHEGNYALRNILNGARMEEEAIEEAIEKGLPLPPPPPPDVSILPRDPSFGRPR